MKTRYLACLLIALACISPVFAHAQASSATPSADSTQNILSPLGLGTGATLGITKQGADVTVAVGGQIPKSPFNFWQVGVFGTLGTNGQQEVYSSSDSDAPGFKAKIGLGHSSMIQPWSNWHTSADVFLGQGWCLDLIGQLGASLSNPKALDVRMAPDCRSAVNAGKVAVSQFPPSDLGNKELAQTVLNSLDSKAGDIVKGDVDDACRPIEAVYNSTSNHDAASLISKLYQSCTTPPTLNNEQAKYKGTALAANYRITGEPNEFQWKAWASWFPTVTSTSYRPLVGSTYNLSDKLTWTKLLNAAVVDGVMYYGPVALGVEGGYGQTVKIVTQNVCNNTTSGTFTAQQCSTAMLGKPSPVDSWLSSATLQVTPIPIFPKGLPLTPGANVTFSYTAPISGGHSSELAIPVYIAPSTSPLAVVIGLQPTWDWNNDPKVGNKFSVSLFVGARPSVPFAVTK